MNNRIEQDSCDKLTQEKNRWKSGVFLGVVLGAALIAVSCTAEPPTETLVPPSAVAPSDTPFSPTESAPADTPVSPTTTAPPEARTPVYGRGPRSYVLPTENGLWVPTEFHAGELPTGIATIGIQEIGEFTFDASQVETLRPDIFLPGHFSLFDVVVHVAEQEDIALEYHFDETMDTHMIDSIDGQGEWWYRGQYSGGWTEDNAFRMDIYPYKNGTRIWLYIEREERLAAIQRSFQEEVERLVSNGGQLIIPEVIIRSPDGQRTFRNVVATAHDLRSDMFQPGVVTALDALLSLAEQGEISSIKLTWYERIGTADPVDTYYVEQIDRFEAYERCGFVYETGPRGLRGNHIHIPSDIRAIVSPEYALWFWICI